MAMHQTGRRVVFPSAPSVSESTSSLGIRQQQWSSDVERNNFLKQLLEAKLSHSRLIQDRILLSKINEDNYLDIRDHVATLEEVMMFNVSVDVLVEILKGIPSLELDATNSKVRPNTRQKIRLRDMPKDTTVEQIEELFRTFPAKPIQIESIPGSWSFYVTFSTEAEAKEALAFVTGLTFRGEQIKAGFCSKIPLAAYLTSTNPLAVNQGNHNQAAMPCPQTLSQPATIMHTTPPLGHAQMTGPFFPPTPAPQPVFVHQTTSMPLPYYNGMAVPGCYLVGGPNGSWHAVTPFMPTNAALMPTNAALMPTNAAMMPTNAALMPTNAAFMSTNAALMPTNAALMPTNPALMQTNPALMQTNALMPANAALQPLSEPSGLNELNNHRDSHRQSSRPSRAVDRSLENNSYRNMPENQLPPRFRRESGKSSGFGGLVPERFEEQLGAASAPAVGRSDFPDYKPASNGFKKSADRRNPFAAKRQGNEDGRNKYHQEVPKKPELKLKPDFEIDDSLHFPQLDAAKVPAKNGVIAGAWNGLNGLSRALADLAIANPTAATISSASAAPCKRNDVADAAHLPQSASSSDTSPLGSSPVCGTTANPSKPVDINVQMPSKKLSYACIVERTAKVSLGTTADNGHLVERLTDACQPSSQQSGASSSCASNLHKKCDIAVRTPVDECSGVRASNRGQ